MLKAQDIVVVIQIIILGGENWTQQKVAYELSMSQSEVSQSIKRLIKCNLMSSPLMETRPEPVLSAVEEFILHGFRYVFPAVTGPITRGIPTSYASPVLQKYITQGTEAPPVWPSAHGSARGYELKPLYKSVPDAILKFKHQRLYEVLTLLDALRHGRARERKKAKELLQSFFEEAAVERESTSKHPKT